MNRSPRVVVLLACASACGYPPLPRLQDAQTDTSGTDSAVTDAVNDAANVDAITTDAPFVDAAPDASLPDARLQDAAPLPDASPTGPNCRLACGPTAASDCCATALVPGNAPGAPHAGQTFSRRYDAATDAFNDASHTATVSSFRLDVYEVTVGRFRAFVDAGGGTQATAPAPGTGAHPHIAGTGWDSAWNSWLPTSSASFRADLSASCSAWNRTWTEASGIHEDRPMNCVPWFEAMAFCIWDGGYLPTEAEWNYAAVGGSEHRAYPWSAPPTTTAIDESLASYNPGPPGYCRGDGVDGCTVDDLVRPGSKPAGNGRWGHADLSGNVSEWTLDWYANPLPSTTCNDCANLTPAQYRAHRGGGYENNASDVRGASFYAEAAYGYGAGLGFRCARPP